MNQQDALRILKFHTVEPAGLCSRMRLGVWPGLESLRELSDALAIIFNDTANDLFLSRDVAYGCGTIIQFHEDHVASMKELNRYEEIQLPLLDVRQKALDVLAGENARDWDAKC